MKKPKLIGRIAAEDITKGDLVEIGISRAYRCPEVGRYVAKLSARKGDKLPVQLASISS